MDLRSPPTPLVAAAGFRWTVEVVCCKGKIVAEHSDLNENQQPYKLARRVAELVSWAGIGNESRLGVVQ